MLKNQYYKKGIHIVIITVAAVIIIVFAIIGNNIMWNDPGDLIAIDSQDEASAVLSDTESIADHSEASREISGEESGPEPLNNTAGDIHEKYDVIEAYNDDTLFYVYHENGNKALIDLGEKVIIAVNNSGLTEFYNNRFIVYEDGNNFYSLYDETGVLLNTFDECNLSSICERKENETVVYNDIPVKELITYNDRKKYMVDKNGNYLAPDGLESSEYKLMYARTNDDGSRDVIAYLSDNNVYIITWAENGEISFEKIDGEYYFEYRHTLNDETYLVFEYFTYGGERSSQTAYDIKTGNEKQGCGEFYHDRTTDTMSDFGTIAGDSSSGGDFSYIINRKGEVLAEHYTQVKITGLNEAIVFHSGDGYCGITMNSKGELVHDPSAGDQYRKNCRDFAELIVKLVSEKNIEELNKYFIDIECHQNLNGDIPEYVPGKDKSLIDAFNYKVSDIKKIDLHYRSWTGLTGIPGDDENAIELHFETDTKGENYLVIEIKEIPDEGFKITYLYMGRYGQY